IPSTDCLLVSTEIASSPARGRPRCFSLEEALDRSLLLFWEKGFQNTSLDEIAEAVGVKKPSLYAAFGDKEMLFRRVLQRYSAKRSEPVQALDRYDDIREAIGAFIELGIAGGCSQGHPRGCLLASAFADSTLLPPNLAKEITALVHQADQTVAKRLKRAVREGQLPADFDANGAAKFLITLMHGIALRIRAGESRASLRRIKKTALRCLG
ncbi:MAG TPA: TetR/AcrR family transcriptional regulator, partial [Chthoniobacterales bacterium]|nr:TetR/AcrR family transcriptional regulator [Chthoniobacterales bacterium]